MPVWSWRCYHQIAVQLVRLLAAFVVTTADQTRAQSTRRPIQAAQACNGSTLVLSCPRGEAIRIWQYGYVPPEVDCSRELDYNFEIGKDSVSYYSNRFVSIARNAQPNLHSIVRSCNGQQRCKLFVKIAQHSAITPTKTSASDVYYTSAADPSPSSSGGTANYEYPLVASRPLSQPGIRVLFSCELVQNYGIPSVRSICDRFEFVTSGRFHLRSPSYPLSAHRNPGLMGRRHAKTTTCSCELRSNFGFNLVVIEMELANGTRSGFSPNAPFGATGGVRPSRDTGDCSSVMRFWNASGHVGILPCVFEPKLRINWHDVIKQQRMGMSLEFTNDAYTSANELMTRFWFEIQPRRSYTCPVFGCSLHECSGDADCHNPQHSCCCDPSVGLRVCKAFSPYDRVEQGILNISCNKMVYSESDPQPPPDSFDNTDGADPQAANRSLSGKGSDSQPADDVLLGVVIGCGMFFAFMLLGASVFIYCYCRAQRSAGSLGVRPRLSKIADQWSAGDSPSANRNVVANERGNYGGNTSSGNVNAQTGGYILKKQQSSSGKNEKDAGRKGSTGKFLQNAKGNKDGNGKLQGSTPNKSPVGRNPSYDGESSFVDFDHDSNRNSHEQSVESRHVVGECLLKLPEDRLHLLGNNGNLICGENTSNDRHQYENLSNVNANKVVSQSLVATATAASAVAADQLLESCSTSFLPPPNQTSVVNADSEEAALLLPIVVECEVIAASETTPGYQQQDQVIITERQLLIDAAVVQSGGSPTSTMTDASNIPHDEDAAFGCDNTVMTGVIVPSSSMSSMKSSTASSSPVTSVIYETLLINPPLSLASNKSYHQGFYPPSNNNNNNNFYISSSQSSGRIQQQQILSGAPHRRFAPPPIIIDHNKKANNNNNVNQIAPPTTTTTTIKNNGDTNETSQQMNHSPSKDSLSSVSGIIKLDIISAF